MVEPKRKKYMNEKVLLHTPFDVNMILVILFLNIFGLIMIYSASYYYAQATYGFDAAYFFRNQLIYVIAGIAVMIAAGFIRPSKYRHLWVVFMIGAAALVAAVRIPGIGWASHGAYRWIKIGSRTIQIAEPVKLLMILFLAGVMTRFRITKPWVHWFIYLFTAVISVGLLVLSNNMSTALIVFGMMFLMMMVSYPRQKWFWIVIAAGVVLAVAGIIYIGRFLPYSKDENFRITRIRAWLDPNAEQYMSDEAYQALQAIYAIGSGGFFGKGLGQSLIKFKLPEPHNDYILAIIFEELGIFGVLLLTYLFIYLLYKIFRVFLETRERFNRLIVLGVFLHLAIQVILNYAVTLGLFPTMGVTLPFISAGGSAVFFTMAEVGLVLAVDRQNREDRLYRQASRELEAEDPYYRRILQEQAEKEEEAAKERKAALLAAKREKDAAKKKKR
ncbi:MAG: cell division protein FtsW [Lachnospiraceae bacterium]|nr:cell division protein FtsW [Lachnospiraceae bacterium]